MIVYGDRSSAGLDYTRFISACCIVYTAGELLSYRLDDSEKRALSQ